MAEEMTTLWLSECKIRDSWLATESSYAAIGSNCRQTQHCYISLNDISHIIIFITIWGERGFQHRGFHPRGFNLRGIHPRVIDLTGYWSHWALIPRRSHPRAIYPREFHPRSIDPRGIHITGHWSRERFILGLFIPGAIYLDEYPWEKNPGMYCTKMKPTSDQCLVGSIPRVFNAPWDQCPRDEWFVGLKPLGWGPLWWKPLGLKSCIPFNICQHLYWIIFIILSRCHDCLLNYIFHSLSRSVNPNEINAHVMETVRSSSLNFFLYIQ